MKGIVFDLDGTLVDSLSVTFDGFNYGISQEGGRIHTPEEIMSYFGPGEGEIFSKILGPEKAQAAYESFQKYMDSHLAKMPLHAGVKELLATLKSENIPLSIFTGRSWNTTELILKHHGLLNRFVTVVSHDHVISPKPSPEGLYLATSRMKLDPAEVFFVGDSPVDILASRAAGSQGIAALWDLRASQSSLQAYEPDHWAWHPKEIMTLFLESH